MSDLNELLADIGDRARVYDVTERALVLGRRRRNTRRLTGVAGIAAMVALSVLGVAYLPTPRASVPPATPSSPAATPSSAPPAVQVAACVPERLPMPPGYPSKSVLTGGDPTGRFLAGRAYPADGRDRLLMWEDGKVKVIRHEGEDAALLDVSSTGIAVGRSFVGDVQVPWIYQDGSLSRLKMKGRHAEATAVNDAGAAVGAFSDSENVFGEALGTRPIVWRSPTAAPAVLTVPAGMAGKATGIDNDGTISGWVSPPPGYAKRGDEPAPPVPPSRAVVWRPDGTMRELTVPDTIDGRPVVRATAEDIRDGQVGGTFATGSHERERRDYVARWNLTTGEVRWHAVAARTDLVNAAGLAVGSTVGNHRYLYLEQGAVHLPNMGGVPDNHATSMDLRAISADGRMVAGYQPVPGAGIVAVLWRCA